MDAGWTKRVWTRRLAINFLPPVLFFLVTWLLYHRALGLAFFWDDPSHSRWFRNYSLWIPETHYYRPFVFFIWKTILVSFGYTPFWFHAFNLVVHGVNAFLVWVLVRMISRRDLLAFLTALLFVAYPFSYQAVAYVGALFHPLTTLFVLAALISYEMYHRNARTVLFWGAHLLLLLAYFSHESAFVTPVLLVTLDLLQGRSMRKSLSFVIVAVVAFSLWLAVPKRVMSISRETGFPLQPLPAIAKHVFYAFHAVFYPLIPLQPLLGSALSRDVNTLSPILGLIGVLIIAVAAWFSPSRRLFGLSAVWTVWFALPAILFLETPYVREGHRLFYLASVGTALLWALVFTAPVYALRTRSSQALAATGIVVAIPVMLLLGQNDLFIQDRIADYERVSLLVRRIAQTAAEAPADRELVYVNLPQFIAPRGNHLLTSPELYGFQEVWTIPGPFTALEDLIRVNGSPPRRARGVFVKALRPYWLPYGTEITLDELRALLQRDVVLLFDPDRWDFVNLSTHWFPSTKESPPAEARVSDAVLFGGRIALEGAQVEWGEEVRVTLWWRCLKFVEKSYTVFTHLYDAVGNLVAQHDGNPVAGVVPTSLWRPGDLIRDVHIISLPNGLRAGRYTLAVGFYDLTTMERLPAVGQGARLFQDDRVPLEERTYPW